MDRERDKLGRFNEGHEGMGGRPRRDNLAKKPENIDEMVQKQLKQWKKQCRVDGKIPALCEGLLISAEAYFKGILALQSKEEYSNTDLRMMHSLGMGLRLSINEIFRIVSKERDRADEEEQKKNGRGFTKKHPTGMY